ncbi:MAG: DUF2270 domain-containing protein [Candidatus Promineifilaceae bacterium]|nr:DUF2270 domain-containing protein [Candidatus Promineifilaceae bacterium]
MSNLQADEPEMQQADLEHLWEFAGQGLDSRDFNTAMVHFYRGEVGRATAWRIRLDATTNWAVIITGASLTFAFGAADHSPVVLIISTILVLIFLLIEARRYRYYELWISRVRIMEQNFFSALLSPPFMPHSDWADKITESLNHPRFPIGLAEAFGRRYRRNYAPILLILSISWIVKVFIHPVEAQNLTVFMNRAAIGPVPGWTVILRGVIVQISLISMGLLTVGLASGEVIDESNRGLRRIKELFQMATAEALEIELPRLSRLDSRKQMAYVISDEVEQIGKALLNELGRGVTMLHGTGMYTGQEHGVLMCALQARQMRYLKQVVQSIDPKAFVIITPVQDVLGFGFRPLEA